MSINLSSLVILVLLLYWCSDQSSADDYEHYEEDYLYNNKEVPETLSYGSGGDEDYDQDTNDDYEYNDYGSGYGTGGYSEPIGMSDALQKL